MTPLQKSKLNNPVDRYADMRQEWFDCPFDNEKSKECALKATAAFDSIVYYIQELVEE